MAREATYAHARSHLRALLDEAAESGEPIVIRRPGAEDVALIALGELRSLLETVYLLRSPKNAERLFRALARATGAE
jgi:antitoxin YefM